MFRFSWFRREPPSAATIRQRLQEVRQRHQQVTAERDALALAVESGDAGASTRYQQLDAEAGQLAQRMRTLEAARPIAEQREGEAARRAEAAALVKRRVVAGKAVHDVQEVAKPEIRLAQWIERREHMRACVHGCSVDALDENLIEQRVPGNLHHGFFAVELVPCKLKIPEVYEDLHAHGTGSTD